MCVGVCTLEIGNSRVVTLLVGRVRSRFYPTAGEGGLYVFRCYVRVYVCWFPPSAYTAKPILQKKKKTKPICKFPGTYSYQGLVFDEINRNSTKVKRKKNRDKIVKKSALSSQYLATMIYYQ